MNNMPNTTVVTSAATTAPAMPVPAQNPNLRPAVPSSDIASGRSIASFIFGLISVILFPIGLIPGFFGFALNLDARRKGSTHSLLSSGRVLSIIGMVITPTLFMLLFLPVMCMAATFGAMA